MSILDMAVLSIILTAAHIACTDGDHHQQPSSLSNPAPGRRTSTLLPNLGSTVSSKSGLKVSSLSSPSMGFSNFTTTELESTSLSSVTACGFLRVCLWTWDRTSGSTASCRVCNDKMKIGYYPSLEPRWDLKLQQPFRQI